MRIDSRAKWNKRTGNECPLSPVDNPGRSRVLKKGWRGENSGSDTRFDGEPNRRISKVNAKSPDRMLDTSSERRCRRSGMRSESTVHHLGKRSDSFERCEN